MVAYTHLQKTAISISAVPLPVCGTGSVWHREPTGVCTEGSCRCPGSPVESKQVLCQWCQKNMQLLSAPVTRRRWITSLNSVPSGTLAAGRQLCEQEFLQAGASPTVFPAAPFWGSLRWKAIFYQFSQTDPCTSTCRSLPWPFCYS